MNQLLKETLASEGVKFTYTSSNQFQGINISKGKLIMAKSILYVLGYKVIFIQPLDKNKFEILFN